MTILPTELDLIRTEVSEDPYQESLNLVCARCRTVIGEADHWDSITHLVRISLDHAVDGTCKR